MVDFAATKCPSCGGELQVPKDQERWTCGWCGNTVIVEDALSLAVLPSSTALRELARGAMAHGQYQEAIRLWDRLLEHNAKDAEAWLQKGFAICQCTEGLWLIDLVPEVIMKSRPDA